MAPHQATELSHAGRCKNTYKFLLHSFCATGHVLPMQAVARALVNRGHEVVWLTHESQRSRVVASGSQFIPTEDVAAVDAALLTAKPTDSEETVDALFGNRVTAQVKEIRRVLATYKPDCLLNDVLPQGAAAIYEFGEVPFYATLGVIPMYLSKEIGDFAGTLETELKDRTTPSLGTLLSYPSMVLPTINTQRTHIGLPPLEASNTLHYSPLLHIQASCPTLEFQKSAELSKEMPQAHYVGPLVTPSTDTSTTLPPWWGDVNNASCLIGITQGTLATDPSALLIPAIEVLQEDTNLLLVVPSPHEEEIRKKIKVFSNVRIASWVPYDKLLPRCRILITNGGYGSVTQALSHGVPLICAGTTEDKKDTAERVTWVGAGIDLGTDNPTKVQIKEAVYKILSDVSYRDKAKQVAKELAGLGGAKRACEILEDAVGKSIIKKDEKRSIFYLEEIV